MKRPSSSLLFLLVLSWLAGSSPGTAESVERLCTDAGSSSEAVYLLPYPAGESYVLLQGNNGPWGHSGAVAWAFDFRMPIGSVVTAARAGAVVGVEESFEDGTRQGGEENYVFIDHGDGTFGRYYHLTKQGVVVQEGDRVEAGQKIGLSGDSGASAGPHLHFDVTTECQAWGCQTIAVEFRNVPAETLAQGESYEALPAPGEAPSPD